MRLECSPSLNHKFPPCDVDMNVDFTYCPPNLYKRKIILTRQINNILATSNQMMTICPSSGCRSITAFDDFSIFFKSSDGDLRGGIVARRMRWCVQVA